MRNLILSINLVLSRRNSSFGLKFVIKEITSKLYLNIILYKTTGMTNIPEKTGSLSNDVGEEL